MKVTIHLGLQFCTRRAKQINCLTDSNWYSDWDDRKSVASFTVSLSPNLVSWSSKKQSIVSRSSTEVEHRALAHATSEVIWVQSLLAKLKIKLSTIRFMLYDN